MEPFPKKKLKEPMKIVVISIDTDISPLCLLQKVTVISDHKPLVAIFKKDIPDLSRHYKGYFCASTSTKLGFCTGQAYNCIKLTGCQGTIMMEGKREILGINLNINAIEICRDILECMKAE